ncbi:hypothetical protein VZQ01_10890 [Myxococcus faecalis]|uniref:hypothetical protein n=1 Tax=Myxococcus TaxID=32 RepID=UPI001144CFC1|nr:MULTISPECIES: hypothetical protein [Myxococcus]MCK8502380.1 hypothetical protein [Myxococcus fulvus]
MPDRPVPGAAADLEFSSRPGVPMETLPHPLPGARMPIRFQHSPVRVFKHPGRAQLPPVYGTAQPPKGLSGLLRRVAYGVPDHKARHWMVLLLADRVDVWEHRLARVLPWALPTAGVLALTHTVWRKWARA